MQPYALMPKQYYCFSTFKCFFILTGDFEVQNFHQITYIHFAIKNQRNMSKILHHFGGACPQKLPAVGSAVPLFPIPLLTLWEKVNLRALNLCSL